LTDAAGKLVNAVLSPGQAADVTWAKPVVTGVRIRQLLADRAYDSNPLRKWLRARRIRPVIPGKKNRKRRIRHAIEAYKRRCRVEHFFSRMKQWSGLALRRDKSDQAFLTWIHLFAIKDFLVALG
jgi:transposase